MASPTARRYKVTFFQVSSTWPKRCQPPTPTPWWTPLTLSLFCRPNPKTNRPTTNPESQPAFQKQLACLLAWLCKWFGSSRCNPKLLKTHHFWVSPMTSQPGQPAPRSWQTFRFCPAHGLGVSMEHLKSSTVYRCFPKIVVPPNH